MSSSNRNLSLVDVTAADLDRAPVPLASKPRPGIDVSAAPASVPRPITVGEVAAYEAENFPAPKIRERVTFVSMRMPNSLLDRVEAVCKERGIDRTALILHVLRTALDARRA